MSGTFRIGSALRSIAVNTGWLFVPKILRIILAFFVTAWLARYLGPSQYGILNYAIAVVFLFGPVTRFGLEGVVVQEIVREPDRRDEILGTTFFLRLIGGAVSMGLVVLAVVLMRPGDALTATLATIIAFGMIFQAYDAIDLWFQAEVQSKYAVYAKSAALIIKNVVMIALIVARASLAAFAWAWALETILAGAGLIIVYRIRGLDIKTWRVSAERSKRLLGLGWPMILASSFAVVYLKIDQIMLGQMSSPSEVGIYSAAVKASETWYFVPTALSISIFPFLVQGKTLGEAVYRARVQQLYDFLVWVSLGVAVVMTFAAHVAVVIVFGEPYARAGTMLAILTWAGVFFFLREALARWFITEGLLIFSFVSNGIGALVNVALNLLFIPRYGGIGAAVATVISYAAAGYLACFITPRTREAAWMMSKALVVPLRALGSLARPASGTGGS
ncbi:MAG TPA: flippase [Candidatus Bathyarchaeia archaeon]|nr:flippase [Candidatus Bathyarchaeia archaeon]